MSNSKVTLSAVAEFVVPSLWGEEVTGVARVAWRNEHSPLLEPCIPDETWVARFHANDTLSLA